MTTKVLAFLRKCCSSYSSSSMSLLIVGCGGHSHHYVSRWRQCQCGTDGRFPSNKDYSGGFRVDGRGIHSEWQIVAGRLWLVSTNGPFAMVKSVKRSFVPSSDPLRRADTSFQRLSVGETNLGVLAGCVAAAVRWASLTFNSNVRTQNLKIFPCQESEPQQNGSGQKL